MLPDFEMVVHQIPTTEDITLVPIFDVHLGAQECREQDFISFINTIAESSSQHSKAAAKLAEEIK